MSEGRRRLLGAATAWAFIYSLAFTVWFWQNIPSDQAYFGQDKVFLGFFIGNCIMLVWIVVLIAVYVKDVARNPAVAPDRKPLWTVLLIVGSVCAMPVYWLRFLRRG